jgi:signal transduction histidine kinase
LGYEAFAIAASAEEAFIEVTKRLPDVVLMDIRIKGALDGISAAKRIQQVLDVPIIYLTAYADEATLERAKLTGPYGYLIKPVSADKLRSAVEIAVHRHRIDQELQKSNEQLAAVLGTIGDGVVVADIDGTITHYNPAAHRILGRGPSEGPASAWSQEFRVYRPDGVTPFPPDELPLAQAIRGNSTDQVEMVIRPASHEQPIYLAVTGRAIKNASGRTTGGVVILHDITQRKQAEETRARAAEALRTSNHDLERFAFVASHDLQQPLRMVTGFVELIERRYAEKLDAPGREFVASALDGARRMEMLITNLLALSRIGTRAIVPKSADASQILEQVLVTLQLPIEEAGAIVLRAKLPQVLVDPLQLGQMFLNLIVNALKFRSDAAPRIDISARRVGSDCEFLVADNGVGILPEHREQIFEMFERLPGRERNTGSGIGLAICKKIAERHGGRIWIDSGAGPGSVFHFTVPAADLIAEHAGIA